MQTLQINPSKSLKLIDGKMVRVRNGARRKPIIEDHVAKIPLTRGMVATIDISDLELVLPFSWHIIPTGNKIYASTETSLRKRIRMHRLILGVTDPGIFVDHINRDGLDNRRSNLRVATREQNARNRVGVLGTSSIYKGVWKQQRGGSWMAKIGKVYLGSFQSEEDAARAYDVAATARYGQFALLNFPLEGVIA